MAYDPASWHDFFVMLGSASAALSGLVFVGLSIHARTVVTDPFLRMRARSLTFGIVYVTIAAGFVLMPGQGSTPLGIEILVGGLAVCGVFAMPLFLFRDQLVPEQALRTGIAVVASGASAYAGVSLLAQAGGGFYVLAAAGLLGVLMNVLGAFSLLLGLARDG